MSGIYLARNNAVQLIPTDDQGASFIQKLVPGEIAFYSVLRPRSVRMHRLYFGLCRAIGKNQDPPRDESSIDYELRIRAGHYDVMIVDGHEARFPKRIAFDKLTHDEWMALWPRLEVAVIERFGEEYILEFCP